MCGVRRVVYAVYYTEPIKNVVPEGISSLNITSVTGTLPVLGETTVPPLQGIISLFVKKYYIYAPAMQRDNM